MYESMPAQLAYGGVRQLTCTTGTDSESFVDPSERTAVISMGTRYFFVGFTTPYPRTTKVLARHNKSFDDW